MSDENNHRWSSAHGKATTPVTEPLTNAMVRDLRSEAHAADDHPLVYECNIVLRAAPVARQRCADAINAARAASEDHGPGFVTVTP